MHNYQIPDAAWVERYSLLSLDLTQKAIKIGLVLPVDQGELSCDQTSPADYACGKPLTEQERLEIRDAVFPVLLLFQYMSWFSASRPRAALENLALDFRDVPSVYAGEEDLLGFVAGISERHSETERELLIARIEIHRTLYKFVRRYITNMYSDQII